ncbi:unnamed protein product [Adineta ricciae]|uniref:Invertebrate defensins family profile domain-containing protein n=2 Tax=Adineta ricciae TaxID=249248 RepID=A0A814YRM8_ADIRI|nr:unnamed protein product [Adineta ricciae]
MPSNPRLSEVNIIIDADNFSQRIVVVLIDYFIEQGCKTVGMVISPSKYIGITSGNYGDQVKSEFFRLIKNGHVLVIPAANSLYYDQTGGYEDAIALHIGMYHRAIVISNDTFKPKIGEEHEFIPDTILQITETKISDTEISLTFTAPSDPTQTGPDILNYVIDHVLVQNTSIDPICTSSSIDCHIPEILKRHRVYNLNKHLDRCDRVVYDHYSKLEKYSQQINSFMRQMEKTSINETELIETLNARKEQVIESREEYKDKIASLLEQNKKFREEIVQQLTVLGNIDYFKPVSIRSGLPYYVFGSENSLDTDILVLLKDYQKPSTYTECQKLMNKFIYEFQDLHCFSNDKPVNINLAVLTDGIITWVLKGIPDETNNSVFSTYHLHTQHHPLEIQRLVSRDREKKIIRATRAILSQLTKSEQRHNVKNALKANKLYLRIDALKPICFQELNFKQSEKDLIETVKLIAFQLANNKYQDNNTFNMVYTHTLFPVLVAVLIIIGKSHSWTWFPDPQRGAALQARWNNYKALPEKTQATVTGVCGKLVQPVCRKVIGRPTDEETESCDKFCCHAGYLTGSCKGSIMGGAQIDLGGPGQTEYKPKINGRSDCVCTNDHRDATCGPDGSFAGIRCPFDKSACARKCCRQGRSGGRCGGFLKTKCKCD